MFEEFQRKQRVPSAQEQKKRQEYLDLVLGKLPDLNES